MRSELAEIRSLPSKSTLVLTDAGWATLVAAAPGHVAEVRRLVIDDLTPTQLRHLRDVGRRVLDRIEAGA